MPKTLITSLFLAGLALSACGERGQGAKGSKNRPTRSGSQGDAMGQAHRRDPAWLSDLRFGATSDRRYQALDVFVSRWPADQDTLPAVLAVLVKDEAQRGGFALSLARLGAPLVPALVDLVRRAPKDEPTLLTAGVLAYSLASPQGLAPLPEAQRRELRKALAPVREALWPIFLADTRPDYEIYQGLATGGLETAERLKPPVPEGGLSRVAMVLYLMLTRVPTEVLLPEVERRQIRRALTPLAPLFAKALGSALPGPKGESPESLLLGLAVLGSAAAASLANEPSLGASERCEALAKVLISLEEQAGPRAAAPARERLAHCAGKLADPGLSAKVKALLPRLVLNR